MNSLASASTETLVSHPRRRSTFFERQSFGKAENVVDKDHAEYKESLTKEIALWKENIRDRSKRIQTLKCDATKEFDFDPETYDQSNLPEEYREFLEAEPDYKKFEEFVGDLKKDTDETKENLKALQKLEAVKIEKIQEKVKEIAKCIIEDAFEK